MKGKNEGKMDRNQVVKANRNSWDQVVKDLTLCYRPISDWTNMKNLTIANFKLNIKRFQNKNVLR